MRTYKCRCFDLGAKSIELHETSLIEQESDYFRARRRHLPHNRYFFRYLIERMQESGPIFRFEKTGLSLKESRW